MSFIPDFDRAERDYRAGLAKIEAALRAVKHPTIPADRAAILLRLGDREMRVADISRQGVYQGSNASYNIDKLTDAGLLDKAPCGDDARATLICATPQGKRLRQLILDHIGEG